MRIIIIIVVEGVRTEEITAKTGQTSRKKLIYHDIPASKCLKYFAVNLLALYMEMLVDEKMRTKEAYGKSVPKMVKCLYTIHINETRNCE